MSPRHGPCWRWCLSAKLSAFLHGQRHFFWWHPQMRLRRVHPLLLDVLPVARWPRPPALRRAARGCVVNFFALLQNLSVLVRVSLLRLHKPNTAVPVLRVVSSHKPLYTRPGLLQIHKPLFWMRWRVLDRSKQGLRLRVVIAHAGPAQRGHHTPAFDGSPASCQAPSNCLCPSAAPIDLD